MKKGITALVLFLCISTVYAATNQLPGQRSEDLSMFNTIGKVVASPDAKQVAFSVTKMISTESGKKWNTKLYIKNEQGKVKLLSKGISPLVLRWSPDGMRIAYIDKGDKYQSIWIQKTSGDIPTKLIEMPNDILSFKYSNDGRYIAFVAKDKKDDVVKPIDVSKTLTARLYLASTKAKQKSDNVIKPVAPNNFNIAILDSNLDGGFDWSPDGKSIVFSYQPKVKLGYSRQNKLAIITLKTGKIKKLPYTIKHYGNQPFYSPDGKWIAFRSDLLPTKKATRLNEEVDLNSQICVTNVSSLKTYCLANTFNENPKILGWNNKSNDVFVFDKFKSSGVQFYELPIEKGGKAKQLSNVNGFIDFVSLSLNRDHDEFGFVYESPSQQPEAYVSSTNTFKLNKVSHVNAPAKHPIGNVKTVSWQSVDGERIEGLLMTPVNYKQGKKYPLLLAVHGGPADAWNKRYIGGCWQYRKMVIPFCWEYFLKKGFVIFKPNPRGSDGYGRKFRLANFGDFGGKDFQDIMSGVDYLVNKGIVDKEHMAIFGWSYGGYMTAWTVTQTNRFKAAVEGAGLTNLVSFLGTADIPEFLVGFLGKPYWEDMDLYLKRSPIMHVTKIKTPLLILAGNNDLRVPISQSYELYTALRIQNKQVKMLMLPGQEHMPTDPNLIVKSIKEVNAWIDRALL